MRLTDLEPHWWIDDNSRRGTGVTFLCPCCRAVRIAVAFANPKDGGPPYPLPDEELWERQGLDFETMTLLPIAPAPGAHWHGDIHAGEVLP